MAIVVIVTRIIGIVLLAFANLAVAFGIWEKVFSGDPKAMLGLVFVGALSIPLVILAFCMLILTGWNHWYFALLAIPVLNILYFVWLMVR